MTYSIYNTSDWSCMRLKKYGPDLINALEIIAKKYPDDISLEILAEEILTGQRQVWLILEKEKFIAFLTTRLETSLTGKKRLLLLELAGKGGVDLTKLLAEIEKYAKSQKVQEICPIGRIGWLKALRRYGYVPEIIKFKKELDYESVLKR